MPLIDALRSGVDLSNAMRQGIITGAQSSVAYPMAQADLYAKQTDNKYLDDRLRLQNQYAGLVNNYYGPEHQAAIDAQTITNKYLPDKLRLANEYQQKQNEWYAPIADASVRNTNMTTDLMPYKTATDMETALKSNSRYGGAFEYLKGLNSMTAAQKDMYLADPNNMQTFTSMMGLAAQGIGQNKGDGSSSMMGQVLTPELISRFKSLTGIGVGSGGLGAPLPAQSAGGNVLQSQQQQGPATPPVSNVPPVIINNAPQQPGGLGAPLSNGLPPRPYLTSFNDMPPQPGIPGQPVPNQPVPVQPGAPNQPQPPVTPAAAHIQRVEQPVAPPTPSQQVEADKLGINPEQAQQIGKNATNSDLSPNERTQLGFQTLANQKAAGMQITNRAQGAIVFEKFLEQNKDKIIPAIRSAATNAGIYGQTAMGLQRFKKEKPEAYQDYLFVTKDLIPNFGFNIKVMEKLASSNQQMAQLNDTYKSSLNWQSDPATAIKNINRTIDMFGGEARAVLQAAQPMYPGALEKLNGIKEPNGEYMDSSHGVDEVQIELPGGRRVWGPRKNSAQVLKSYPGAKVVQ